MNPPRRRHRRRKRQNTVPGLSLDSEPSAHPVQVEQKYCEAVLDEDDDECLHQPLCLELLPMDGPRLCRRHLAECSESYQIYKAASQRMEALRQRVLGFSRRNRQGGFYRVREVEEAIDVTEEFIFWADVELRERRGHTRFYAIGTYMFVLGTHFACTCTN